MFYGDEERNALTLHFESSDQTRLFGSPAFIYLPTAAWLDYYWAKARICVACTAVNVFDLPHISGQCMTPRHASPTNLNILHEAEVITVC